jgi:hypothetical protein
VPKKHHVFAVGERVAYSVKWLRSTGNQTGRLPFLRGEVRATTEFSGGQICVIAWDNYSVESMYHDDGMARILGANLTLESEIAFDSAL